MWVHFQVPLYNYFWRGSFKMYLGKVPWRSPSLRNASSQWGKKFLTRGHTAHTITNHMDISLFTSFPRILRKPFLQLSIIIIIIMVVVILTLSHFAFSQIPFAAYSSFLRWSRSIEFQRLTLKTACIDATHYISFIRGEGLRYLVSSRY